MSYTREQRAANAAKAAEAAAAGAPQENTQFEPPDIDASAPVKPTGERPPSGNDVRDEAMEQILKARGEPDEETATAAPAASASPSTEGVAAQTAAEPMPAVEPAPVEMVKVKVNGVESEVPKSEVEDYGGVRAYQIAKAGEHHLKEAKEAAAETKRAQAEMARVLQAFAPKQPPPATDDEFLKEKLPTFRYGSDEEALTAFKELIARANPRVNENELMIKVTASTKFDAAEAKFNAEFSDVMANPDLAELVRIKKAREMQKYAPNGQANWAQLAIVDFDSMLRNIGNQVRSVTAPRPSQPQPGVDVTTSNPSSGLSDKEERKSSIVNLPTAAARASLPAEEKPETREETLASMRAARGQSPT